MNTAVYSWLLVDKEKETSLKRHLENVRKSGAAAAAACEPLNALQILQTIFILKIPVFRWCCLPRIHTGSSVSGNSSK